MHIRTNVFVQYIFGVCVCALLLNAILYCQPTTNYWIKLKSFFFRYAKWPTWHWHRTEVLLISQNVVNFVPNEYNNPCSSNVCYGHFIAFILTTNYWPSPSNIIHPIGMNASSISLMICGWYFFSKLMARSTWSVFFTGTQAHSHNNKNARNFYFFSRIMAYAQCFSHLSDLL